MKEKKNDSRRRQKSAEENVSGDNEIRHSDLK